MNRFAILLFTALVAGCGSSEDDDKGGQTPKGGLVFTPDARSAGASVRLEQKELTDTRLVLEIVADDVSDLYGLAFRLKLDPEVLGFEAMQPGTVWNGFTHRLDKAALGSPSVVVGVVSGKGAQSGLAADDQVLATLTLSRKTAAPTQIAFDAAPSALVAADGREIEVDWYGGALTEQD